MKNNMRKIINLVTLLTFPKKKSSQDYLSDKKEYKYICKIFNTFVNEKENDSLPETIYQKMQMIDFFW